MKLNYFAHAKSTRSKSMYFLFDGGDIIVRVSDHKLKENDVDIIAVGNDNKVFSAIRKKYIKIKNGVENKPHSS